MTYSAVYCALISKRLSNPLPKEEYGEVHHIIPKSEGGTNDNDNLVRLSAREHYIAHLLLAKIYNDQKMWCAIHLMSTMNDKHHTRVTSRMYAVIRDNFSKKHSEFMRSEKNPWLGKTCSDEHKRKLSMSVRSERNGMFGKRRIFSEESKKKMSESHRGFRWYTDGTKSVQAKTCPDGFKPGKIQRKKQKKNSLVKKIRIISKIPENVKSEKIFWRKNPPFPKKSRPRPELKERTRPSLLGNSRLFARNSSKIEIFARNSSKN